MSSVCPLISTGTLNVHVNYMRFKCWLQFCNCDQIYHIDKSLSLLNKAIERNILLHIARYCILHAIVYCTFMYIARLCIARYCILHAIAYCTFMYIACYCTLHVIVYCTFMYCMLLYLARYCILHVYVYCMLLYIARYCILHVIRKSFLVAMNDCLGVEHILLLVVSEKNMQLIKVFSSLCNANAFI